MFFVINTRARDFVLKIGLRRCVAREDDDPEFLDRQRSARGTHSKRDLSLILSELRRRRGIYWTMSITHYACYYRGYHGSIKRNVMRVCNRVIIVDELIDPPLSDSPDG